MLTTTEPPDDPDPPLNADSPGAGETLPALAADETLGAFAAAVEAPGNNEDASLREDAKLLPEANVGDGGRPAPQPRCDCEPVST